MRKGQHLYKLRVVLVNPRNPLNIGAAARAMSNFGFEHLRVVNPFELAFREARSAVGAAPVLAKAEESRSVAEAVADCMLVVGTTALSRRNPEQRVRDLRRGAQLIRNGLAMGRVALLFGSEKRGLSNADLSHCHWLVRVPTCEAQRSMNLGQAVAVCLYELAGAANLVVPAEQAGYAAASDLERLTSMLFDALGQSGYLKTASENERRPSGGASQKEKIRRLVWRLKLSRRDAELLLGMLRQILWTLGEVERGHLNT